VFRYLRTLATLGLSSMTPRLTAIGWHWPVAAVACKQPHETLRQACKPQMKRFASASTDPNLGVLSGGEVFLSRRAERQSSACSRASAPDPPQHRARQVFLAFRPAGQRALLIPQRSTTRNTITDRAPSSTSSISSAPRVCDRDRQNEKARTIAAPILDRRDVAIAAMSLSAPFRVSTSKRQRSAPNHRLQRDRPTLRGDTTRHLGTKAVAEPDDLAESP
jgi:DNA-binding IclR family transcriptional regulator